MLELSLIRSRNGAPSRKRCVVNGQNDSRQATNESSPHVVSGFIFWGYHTLRLTAALTLILLQKKCPAQIPTNLSQKNGLQC